MYLVAWVEKDTGEVEAFQTFSSHIMAVNCVHLLAKKAGIETKFEDFIHNGKPTSVRINLDTHCLNLIVDEVDFHDWL